LQFEPDGDLQAINGAGSTQISIRKTENQEFLVKDWEFDEILDDNDAAYDSTRDNVRDKLNDDIFNGDLKPTAVGITVKNNVSAVLAKGTPVYVSGYDSSSRLPLVAGSYKATAGTMPATFILNEDLAANGTGEALLIGTLSDIDTSSFSVGDELYVNEANLSDTIPTGTNAVQSVGFVLESHATTGKVALHGLGATAPTDTDTNIGNTNLSISSGTRSLSLSGTNTSFRIMTGQGTPFRVTNTSGNGGSVTINGDFRVDSGALSGGIIKLEENPQGGSNFVALQAPNSLSSDLTFVMPSADGSAGQFLKTDGSGSLSFGSAGSSSTIKWFIAGGAQVAFPYARYLPLTGDVFEQNTASSALSRTGFVAPYDGEVKKVMFRSQETLGNTELRWYKATDGTHAPATSLQTVTIDYDTADKTETYTYSTVTFSKGDVLSLRWDPTSDPVSSTCELNYTVELEFDTST
jgi:hypothetical protein